MIVLKPQDILILLKVVTMKGRQWTYASLASELFMSASEVHAAIKRASTARLWDTHTKFPFRRPLVEFIVHGLKYAFPPNHGGIVRGMPTACDAPPLNRVIAPPEEFPLVWPDPEGTVRGCELLPLYRSVTKAAAVDPELYELLTLVDAVRVGKARERKIAVEELKNRMMSQ